MGQVIKRGDVFYIEFFARGLMYSQVAGENEEEAKKMLREIEAKISQGESLTIVREIELDVFFEKFVDYAGSKFHSQSMARFQRAWNHWKLFLLKDYPQVHKLSQITPSVIESYKALLVKTAKPKVVNLTLLLLREILDYGIRIGFINDNPTLHAQLLRISLKREAHSPRSILAKDLLKRNMNLERLCFLLKIKDVGRIMYWAAYIPVNREDIYTV